MRRNNVASSRRPFGRRKMCGAGKSAGGAPESAREETEAHEAAVKDKCRTERDVSARLGDAGFKIGCGLVSHAC